MEMSQNRCEFFPLLPIPSTLLYARWLVNREIILVTHPSVDILQRVVSKFSFYCPPIIVCAAFASLRPIELIEVTVFALEEGGGRRTKEGGSVEVVDFDAATMGHRGRGEESVWQVFPINTDY